MPHVFSPRSPPHQIHTQYQQINLLYFRNFATITQGVSSTYSFPILQTCPPLSHPPWERGRSIPPAPAVSDHGLCCGCHLTVLLWKLASPITQLLNPQPRPLLLSQPFTLQEYTNAPISYGKKPTNEQKPFLTSTSPYSQIP